MDMIHTLYVTLGGKWKPSPNSKESTLDKGRCSDHLQFERRNRGLVTRPKKR